MTHYQISASAMRNYRVRRVRSAIRKTMWLTIWAAAILILINSLYLADDMSLRLLELLGFK